jgi:hypothetical protein
VQGLESCQPGRKIAPEKIQRHTETDETGQHIVGHRGVGLVVELQNAPRILQELAAFRRQLNHAAFAPFQQALANLLFKLVDLLADGRLGSPDVVGGARETHIVCDQQKRAQAIYVEIHRGSPVLENTI